MKILILKRDKIGDMLLTTPMLAHLRTAWPRAEIHVLATDYNAWVLAGNRNVDKVWSYPRARTGRAISVGAVLRQIALTIRLRAMRFDVAIAAGGDVSPRALRRVRSIGAKRTIAYVVDADVGGDLLPPPCDTHEIERMLGLLAPLNIAAPTRVPWPEFVVPTESGTFAMAWLGERGVRPQGYVVVGLGARRAKKQPSAAQILRWSQRWYERHGLHTVFMWTPGKTDDPLYPGDDAAAAPVVAAGRAYIHPFRGALRPALGLIHYARTSLFPDSGLMHFAAASPGGVLGLFADTNASPPPAQWGPRGPRATYIEAARAVSELDDEVIFAKLEALLAPSVSAEIGV